MSIVIKNYKIKIIKTNLFIIFQKIVIAENIQVPKIINLKIFLLTNLYILFNSPIFLKVRTINFSNYDDDVYGYNPELYVLKNVSNSSKVISNYNIANNDEKLNCDVNTYNDADEIIKHKTNMDNKSSILNDSITNSDDESSVDKNCSKNNDEEGSDKSDESKYIEDDDYYGPTFFQNSTHWVCI